MIICTCNYYMITNSHFKMRSQQKLFFTMESRFIFTGLEHVDSYFIFPFFAAAKSIGNCWGCIKHSEELDDMQKVGKLLKNLNFRSLFQVEVVSLIAQCQIFLTNLFSIGPFLILVHLLLYFECGPVYRHLIGCFIVL